MKQLHFDIGKTVWKWNVCVLYCKNHIENVPENIAFGLASAKDSCTIILGSRILTGKNYGTRYISPKRKIEGTESKKYSFRTRRFGNLETEEKKSWFRLASARDEGPADKVIGHFRRCTLWHPLAPVGTRQHPLGHTGSPLKGFLGRAGETLYKEWVLGRIVVL